MTVKFSSRERRGEAAITRIVIRVFIGLVVLGLVFYAADYAVWHLRVKHGSGVETVTVSRVSVAPLKGGKEEFYFDGTDTAPCTISLLPPLTRQGWGTPCWWLRRHRQVVTRY